MAPPAFARRALVTSSTSTLARSSTEGASSHVLLSAFTRRAIRRASFTSSWAAARTEAAEDRPRGRRSGSPGEATSSSSRPMASLPSRPPAARMHSATCTPCREATLRLTCSSSSRIVLERVRLLRHSHLQVETVRSQAFNIGAHSENYRVRDLAEIVRETFPRCVVEYAADAGPDPRSYRVDFGKLARTFREFRPRWTAADGARDLFSAFRKVGLTASAFEGDKYTRLVRLKLLGARVARFAGNSRVGVARRTMPICTPAHGGRDFEPWLGPSGEAA